MRPTWDAYFVSIAKAAATRSTCPRLSVGCVLVRDRQILSTGMNGAAPGDDHCDSHGCDIGPAGGCVRTQHAEANAVCLAARAGIELDKATAYLTDAPCLSCARLLAMAGIVAVVYEREYRLTAGVDFLKARGVVVERLAS
jgi:dCMP deaminase